MVCVRAFLGEMGLVGENDLEEERWGRVNEVTSVRVFHCLQAEHCPDHLLNSLPQEEHIKREKFFAIGLVYLKVEIRVFHKRMCFSFLIVFEVKIWRYISIGYYRLSRC